MKTNMIRSLMMLTLTLILSVVGCHRDDSNHQGARNEASGEPLVRVVPVHPTRETAIRHCEQPGQIVPIEAAPIHAKVSGFVRRVHVDIGDVVKGPVYDDSGKLTEHGQLLLEIDAPELEKEQTQKQALITQAEAEARQAQAAIAVANAARDSAAADVEEAKAMVDRVAAERDRWQSEFTRISDLAGRQAVTGKLVEETESKYRAADAARKEVAAKIRSAEARLLEADANIEKAKADAEAAVAKRAVAVADKERTAALLDYANVRAPFDGIISARNVDAGHLVSSTSSAKEPLLVVVRTDSVRVVVDVPEIDAIHLTPDAEAQLRVTAMATKEFTGKVTRTAWVLDQATRTLRVEINVPNEDGRLRPGMYAYAKLKVAEQANALMIPRTAVMTTGGQSHVWKIDADGKLIKQPVELGIEAGGKLEVLTGLEESNAIIGVNPSAFREGQRVEVASASTAR